MNAKKPFLMWILLMAMTLFISSVVPQTVLAQGSIIEEKGTLFDVLKTFRNRIIPGYSEMYAAPGDEELHQMQRLASMAAISARTNDTINLSRSSLEASKIGYEFVRLTNENNGAVYYILREADVRNRGWGLYIFRAGNESSDLVVEAPHPLSDLQTDRIAVLAFERSRAKAFLLAGAHRNANRDRSADVANFPWSIFQAVHEEVTSPSTIVIDIHGFSLENEPGYPQIILSSGEGKATLPIKELFSFLSAKNFTTGIVDGKKLRELEGANDMQGKYANSIGASFIHMELERSIRNSPPEYRKVVDAINELDSKYINKSEVENLKITDAQMNKTYANFNDPVAVRFTEQLGHELWFYIAAILIMFGGFIILLLERRNSKFF